MDVLQLLGSEKDAGQFAKHGPSTCPCSRYVQKDLNFKVTQVSDCAVVSAEVSPAGVINLISHCWEAVMNLLTLGVMCRGYITKGSIYHHSTMVIGTGYVDAFEKESGVSAFKMEADERGTPFVEIDPAVCAYVKNSGDACVMEMFKRMAKSEDGLTAIFPCQLLSHSFMIHPYGRPFDADREKQSNNNLRKIIVDLRDRIMGSVDESNESALMKAKHYCRALDDQLRVCDHTDEAIDQLTRRSYE